MIGHDAIELFAREWLRIVRELLDRPAAQVVDPLARRDGLRPGAQFVERLFARAHSIPTHLVLPRRPVPQQVHVVVDQPGDDGAAAQIDPPRVRTGEPADVLVRADRHDPIGADRHRLRDREAIVDGDDLAIRQD